MYRKRRSLFNHIATLLALAILLAAIVLPEVSAGAAKASNEPRLLRVSPSHDGTVGRDVTVALSFDRPIDLDSLKEAVSFSPAVDFNVSGEAECLVVPLNLLQGGKSYTFRLEPGRARDLQGQIYEGQVEETFSTRDDVMTLEIPALSFSGEIVEGEDPQAVTNSIGFGVGQYPGTGRPGSGNLVLMAHASGQIPFPFNSLQELKAGDEMDVTYGGRIYAYRWKEGLVVPETAMWILDPKPYSTITFFVCCAADGKPSPTFHPPYRYVVQAPLGEFTFSNIR
jgi:LPXTG-site transpeptidase (sortase) family protein